MGMRRSLPSPEGEGGFFVRSFSPSLGSRGGGSSLPLGLFVGTVISNVSCGVRVSRLEERLPPVALPS